MGAQVPNPRESPHAICSVSERSISHARDDYHYTMRPSDSAGEEQVLGVRYRPPPADAGIVTLSQAWPERPCAFSPGSPVFLGVCRD
jgi:hypothetical protein